MSAHEHEVARVGRPRALDEVKRREICALVSAGVSLQSAAEYVGCCYTTVYRERQRDEEFRIQLGRAKAVRQLAPLQLMRQAAQHNWRAAAWMLERTEPDRFGRRAPHAFGAHELRALKRDLLEIFEEAIDQPQLREQVVERMRTVMNYAMRHTWDSRRTGTSLRHALQLYADPKPPSNLWDDVERSLDELASACGLTSSADNFARNETPDLAKNATDDCLLARENIENQAIFERNGESGR